MPKHAQLKRQRARLYHEQSGLCWWCHKPMKLIDFRPAKGIPHPVDMATVEHLDDRHNPDRGKFPVQRRHVVACWFCNNKRGRESHIAHWRKSESAKSALSQQ